MKKVIILLLSLLLITACSNKDNVDEMIKDKKTDDLVPEEVLPSYVDLNNTPIGIYKLEGEKLTKLNQINTDLVVEKDIGTFQIFPSNLDVVNLDKPFGKAFYDEWQKYNIDNNLGIGFNIKYSLDDGNDFSYNILNPSQTFEHWEYLMNYLYDDYANLGKGFYSHIENDQYNQNTLFTAFKMQSSYQCSEIKSISLSVFTYDSDDDFLDNVYRGNSIHTFKICVRGKEC